MKASNRPAALVLVTMAGGVLLALGQLVGAAPSYVAGLGALVLGCGVVGAGASAAVVARANGSTMRRTLWEAVKTAFGWLFAFLP